MSQIDSYHFLKAHLNAAWLRPETALCDAIASSVLSRYNITHPSLDLGCGNGVFSFITAGGNFSLEYDWYIDSNLNGFWDNKDIHDVCNMNSLDCYINEKPKYRFTYGLDHKPNLLKQSQLLNFYDNLVEYDANLPLPFRDNKFKTIFSNILYWLNSPQKALIEVYRILDQNGMAILCVPSPKFKEYCFTYDWEKKKSPLLKKLNRGRSKNVSWFMDYDDFARMSERIGFKIIDCPSYYSKLTLTVYDIGLRPLLPLLVKMANNLKPEKRNEIKREWLETLMDFILPLYEMEKESKEEKGFNLFVLQK